jgi:hypothetical protein
MPWCIQGSGSHNRHLIFRISTSLALQEFSAKISIVNLDFSLQEVAIIPFAHRRHDFAAEHPGSVISKGFSRFKGWRSSFDDY